MTTPARDTPGASRPARLIGWWTSLAIPAAVFIACVLFDVFADRQQTSSAGVSALVALAAGILQIVVLLALAPWWGTGLVRPSPWGALIAAARVLAFVAATGVLLAAYTALQEDAAPMAVVKVQAVVLGVGLLVAGTAATLSMVFRSGAGSAAFTMLTGFALTASPFWGNVLVRWAGEGWKPLAIAFVVKATPISACAQAVRYDLFRGKALYDVSLVSNYPYHLPDWSLYALFTGAAGILLLELAAFIRSRTSSSTSPSGGG